MCFVDDVVIAIPTLEDHIERLDEVFACMKRSGLKCKPSKCEILKDSIKYLGRMVDKHGIRQNPDTVEAVLTWKSPKTEHQLMSFFGFANYYREFIKGYADKVYPMQQLMRHKGKKCTWNNAASGRINPKNKKGAMRSTSAGDAHGKRNVRAGHGCIGGSDLWDTPPRTGMERKDSLETDSLREQSLE